MKKVIAACIDKVLEFDTPEEAAAYIENLRNKKTEFRFSNREEVNGKCRIRIQEQYNKTPMIEN
jgi:hypothetical protein